MRGARAERIEYLLLHEFHNLKYVTPERVGYGSGGKGGKGKKGGEEGGGEEDGVGGGGGRKRGKPSYSGGLVLEPKKGLYDSYILLLDFNSLYPSIIQEYNLCFTTIDWPQFASPSTTTTTTDRLGRARVGG